MAAGILGMVARPITDKEKSTKNRSREAESPIRNRTKSGRRERSTGRFPKAGPSESRSRIRPERPAKAPTQPRQRSTTPDRKRQTRTASAGETFLLCANQVLSEPESENHAPELDLERQPAAAIESPPPKMRSHRQTRAS